MWQNMRLSTKLYGITFILLLITFAIIYFIHDLVVKERIYFIIFVIIGLSTICFATIAHIFKTEEIVNDIRKENKRKKELGYYGEDCKFIH